MPSPNIGFGLVTDSGFGEGINRIKEIKVTETLEFWKRKFFVYFFEMILQEKPLQKFSKMARNEVNPWNK